MNEEEKKANKKIYLCDVEKNKECNKRYCYINGGPCNATTDKTKAINNMSEEENEEEKKAIKILKENYVDYEDTTMFLPRDRKAIIIILNLIEKQQKEIEELKEDNKHQWDERCRLTFEIEKLEEKYISKDKIKEKIEELKKVKGDFAIYIAKSEMIAVLEEFLKESE